MPSYAYSEDVVMEAEELSDADIRECEDTDQLIAWHDDLEALSDDIEAQLHGYRASGIDNLPWVYRACQKLGFLGRARSRLRKRLHALDHNLNPLGRKIEQLNRKIQNYRAESGVAVEFMRLALERMSHVEFAAMESEAVHALAQRMKKEADEAAKERAREAA